MAEMRSWARSEDVRITKIDRDVEFAVGSDWHPTVQIDPRRLLVTFKDMELEVSGELEVDEDDGEGRYSSLRQRVIKLAHEQPPLRRHLVKILRDSKKGSIDPRRA